MSALPPIASSSATSATSATPIKRQPVRVHPPVTCHRSPVSFPCPCAPVPPIYYFFVSFAEQPQPPAQPSLRRADNIRHARRPRNPTVRPMATATMRVSGLMTSERSPPGRHLLRPAKPAQSYRRRRCRPTSSRQSRERASRWWSRTESRGRRIPSGRSRSAV